MRDDLLKKKIEREVRETYEEFMKREDVKCRFDEPVIAYLDAENLLFDSLYARGICKHPKEIYTPGHTFVAYYIPYAEEVVKENEAAAEPTEEWQRGWIESLWLAMFLNRTIIKAISSQGRLTSRLSTMIEWDWEKCSEPWSNRLAAAVCGFGELGPAGSFHYNGRYGGRVGAIITDGRYAELAEPIAEEEIEGALKKLLDPCLFDGPCSQDMIDACPCGAVSADGIDRFKCQEYCKSLDSVSPSPNVCGKCFRFKQK